MVFYKSMVVIQGDIEIHIASTANGGRSWQ